MNSDPGLAPSVIGAALVVLMVAIVANAIGSPPPDLSGIDWWTVAKVWGALDLVGLAALVAMVRLLA